MSSTRIPKKIHFIYGLKPDFGGIPFNFSHWVAVRTAQRCNPGYAIHFWYEHKPENLYFQDLESDIILHHVKAPESIFGNPIPHFAHRADVLRLQTLLEHGGIYLDVDTITVKPYDDLLGHEVFMAKVKNNGNLYGLCNAVMGGAPAAAFFQNWLEGFRNFRSEGYDRFYDEFACEYPLKLASAIPDSITVYDEHAFFVPDMTISGMSQLFLETGEYPQAWCHHLWEKNAIKALLRFNERNYASLPCTYTNHIRRLIADDCDRLAASRDAWCHQQLQGGKASLSFCVGRSINPSAVNADVSAATGPDFVFDPAVERWPFPDNCFEQIQISRLIESLPQNPSHFFKELYRVAQTGCAINIQLVHPRHDSFLQDPSFCRGWIAGSFLSMNRQHCARLLFSGGDDPLLAFDWNVDFEIIGNDMTSPMAELLGHLEKVTSLNQATVASVFYNMINSTRITLRARKPDGCQSAEAV